MKKLFFTISILFLVPFFLNASQVTLNEASQVAVNFYYERVSQYHNILSESLKAEESFTVRSKQTVCYYIFNISEGGFVVVSADDQLPPVLAYSFHGKYQETQQPDNFNAWMNFYKRQIVYAVKNQNFAKKSFQSEWQRLLDASRGGRQPFTGKSVEPLLTSQWNQDTPYNALCPDDAAGPGGHAYAGCVATAMGQLMYYFRWPETGTGSYTYEHPEYGTISADFGATTYQWDQMLNSISSRNDAIATLLFHLGVSVDMNYGPNGSGMWNHKAAYSLRTYFKYSPQTQYVFRDSTTLNWDSLLVTHLDKKIPMYYAGWSDYVYVMGHAFVCDGYQGEDYYHFNWGWSGSYDGYFYTDNLTPGGNNFNLVQELIINCYPDTVNYTYPQYCNGASAFSSTEGSFTDGSGEKNYQPGADCSWLIAPNDPELDSVTSLNLNFSYFDTEENHDILTVYDGADVNAPVLGIFSGNTLPSQLVSSGDKMFITFTSDINEIQAAGFHTQYTSNFPEYCSGITTFTDPSGLFSDGSGDKHYSNGTLCRWKIQPAEAQWVTLYFDSFQIEAGKDLVKVFDLANNQLLATYSGDTLPVPVTSPSGKMFVTFFTDQNNTADGFSAHYESGLVGICENLPENQVLVSPNPAKDFITVSVNEEGMEQCKIEITDIFGKTCYCSGMLSNINKSERFTIQFALKKGIYFIKIFNKNELYTKKMVVD